MSLSLSILVHLKAGGNEGMQSLEKFQAACTNRRYPYKVYISEYAGHTKELICQIVQNPANHHDRHRLIVIGGDGTMNEAVYSLVVHQLSVPIAYFPSGTGNDFARSLQLSHRVEEFLDLLETVPATSLEVIQAINLSTKQLEAVGINGIGFGFDALISHLNDLSKENKALSKKNLGKLSYLAQIIRAFKNRQTYTADIVAENGQVIHYEDILLASFMKHPYFGGGVRIDPFSGVNNQQIGLVLAHHITGPLIMRLIPIILTTGKHFNRVPELLHFSSPSFTISIQETTYMQADGEVSQPKTSNYELSLTQIPIWRTSPTQ